MPLCSDPNRTCWLSLTIDKALPDESRPAFRCRFLTISQRRAVREKYIEALAEKDDEKSIRLCDETLAMAYVGWRNVVDANGVPIPFELGFAALDSLLTPDEKSELIGKSIWGTAPSEAELKKFVSAARSDMAVSPAPVPADAVSAPTPGAS